MLRSGGQKQSKLPTVSVAYESRFTFLYALIIDCRSLFHWFDQSNQCEGQGNSRAR